jgi:hypothetical protein
LSYLYNKEGFNQQNYHWNSGSTDFNKIIKFLLKALKQW